MLRLTFASGVAYRSGSNRIKKAPPSTGRLAFIFPYFEFTSITYANNGTPTSTGTTINQYLIASASINATIITSRRFQFWRLVTIVYAIPRRNRKHFFFSASCGIRILKEKSTTAHHLGAIHEGIVNVLAVMTCCFPSAGLGQGPQHGPAPGPEGTG